ncbi:MAG: hypothetical protein OXH47_07890, partial [Paracoccaceae bacterium]|nr:hypothetical protein [Paracoccaceae bacterium]
MLEDWSWVEIDFSLAVALTIGNTIRQAVAAVHLRGKSKRSIIYFLRDLQFVRACPAGRSLLGSLHRILGCRLDRIEVLLRKDQSIANVEVHSKSNSV